jgi:phosphoribosylglycinamide formyltransferase-1
MAKRISVLISGRGSNLASLLDAMREGTLGGTITRVFANIPDVPGLAVARTHGVDTKVVDNRAFATREAFDAVLADAIDAEQPDLVVLAGFMRVLGAPFVRRYRTASSTCTRRCCRSIPACIRIGAHWRTARASTAALSIS